MGLAFSFARRELRGGFSGFFVFLVCIALGVASIAGVNSLARSLSEGLQREGRVILGGDIDAAVQQRLPGEAERAALEALGRVSTLIELRAMARSEDGTEQSVVEIKAVDGAYPLVGAVTLEGDPAPADLAALLADGDGMPGLLAEPALAARLGVAVGGTVRIGDARFRLAGLIAVEPDRLSDGFGFGPRAIMSTDAVPATGLMQPGSLFQSHTRVALDDASQAGLERALQTLEEAFTDTGFRLRSRERASPRLETAIERFAQFLTLVGLTALVVGGVGVANAVNAFVDRKRKVIAAMKALGAPGGFIVQMQFFQVMAIALVGIAAGLVVGALLPPLVEALFGDVIPVPLASGVYPDALLLAVVYGLLVALAFSLWPLGAARGVKATELFRDSAGGMARRPRLVYAAFALIAVAALAGLAVLAAEQRTVALAYVIAAAASFLVLRLVGWAVMAMARRLPRPGSTALRLAIGNIHKPGALTPSVVLSLGLGLTLLVALALVDGNLRRQLTGNLPAVAPSFFVLDIPSREIETFRAAVLAAAPDAAIETVPMLRGRIVSLRGIAAADYPTHPEAEWVLRGDRGITYAAAPPEGRILTEGAWWPEDYDGPPLVSFVEEEGRQLGLALGDAITVNVLGREITATIASFRDVEWGTLEINFAMVFSPNTFRGAPHSILATITLPEGGTRDQELALLSAITDALPNVTAVRVKEALDTVNALVADLALAVRGAASIALVASVLVLGGALAAGHRRRVYDAVILKTLGARRRVILSAFVMEYGLLGLFAGVFGLIAGTLAAFGVVTFVMGLDFAFLPVVAFGSAALALVVTLGLGLAGTFRILGQKAAPVLRNL
ncbi:MAG: FtsX-like permease family protein [Hyphomicrobiaceae bacterium]|nr:FtsX-like permease family protein [Hyphomicrobiaceae bacterium]